MKLRSLFVATSLAVAGIGGGMVVTASPASADPCAQLRVYVNGAISRVGPNCVYDSEDLCIDNDPTFTPNGMGAYGAGVTLCVPVPVATVV